jgi:two-component system sensor histidine kinase BaeS
VGWLSISPPEFLSDQLDVQFQAQQSRTFWLIAVISIATAALMAVLLARHLLAPIRGLTKGARALTAGQFGARAQVTSSDELGQLAADFNILAETLEQNERARRQWVADISHELRTPLAVLRGEIEAIEDGVRPFDASSLKSIHGEVLRLAKLVEDLYELSLSDLGALNYRKEKTDLIEALDAALTAFSHRFAQQEISVTSSLNHDRPILVFADAQRLFQLFSNLLENSLRYTDSGGQLRVRCEETDKLAIMHFQDSAPGVSEEALPKLFERLYRVESSRNRARGGAGLGLAICKNIVAAHGGEITALSSPLGGLWIRIQLPLNSS